MNKVTPSSPGRDVTRKVRKKGLRGDRGERRGACAAEALKLRVDSSTRGSPVDGVISKSHTIYSFLVFLL